MTEKLIYEIFSADQWASLPPLLFPFDQIFMTNSKLFEELRGKSSSICLGYDQQRPTQLLIFNHHLSRLLFIYEARLSFQVREPTKILHDLTLSPDLTSCESKLYSVEERSLIFRSLSKSTSSSTEASYVKHVLFDESYAKLAVQIAHSNSGFIIKTNDRFGNSPVEFCWWNLIASPIERFKLILEQMALPANHFSRQMFLKSARQLIAEISSADSALQTQLFEQIRCCAPSPYSLITMRAHLLHDHPTEQEALFIDQLIKYGHVTCGSSLSSAHHHPQSSVKQPSPSAPGMMQARRQQAVKSGTVFAYDIPDLLAYTAGSFCKSELALNQYAGLGCDSFIELDIDPESIEINPSTGLLNYNKGHLIAALDEHGSPRAYGHNSCGVVIGIHTLDLGIGIPAARVLIIGDLTHSSKGVITMEECVRINAAIRYAHEHGMPIDWFTASCGVEIHKEHGVENLDASASTCREIVCYSQDCGVPINIIVYEVNIGAQSYWDALAAICQDTHSLLIMTAKGTMSLTGYQALTSAYYRNLHSEDIATYAHKLFPEGLQTLAGYRQVHGPNGEATNFALDVRHACELLIQHHYFTYSSHYSMPATKRPCKHPDPSDRSILRYTYPHHDLSIEKELQKILAGYKANRHAIIEALRDQHTPSPLYLWQEACGIEQADHKHGGMPQTSSTLVCELIFGKQPTLLIFTPLGPLTPLDSEIIAKAINKASGHLPVLILGNLTGFNSDPLSMQNRQLTQGASIVRAIVHYRGALVIANLGCMVGGAYVVFSKQLNPFMRIVAVEGARAQVVGGNIAAKIVFHSRICQRAKQDPRLAGQIAQKVSADIPHDKKFNELFRSIVSQIEEEEEAIFNQIHDAERAKAVGSIDLIVPAQDLRPTLIHMIEETTVLFNAQHAPVLT